MTGSIKSSLGARQVDPTAEKSASATPASASLAAALGQSTLAPAPTRAGVLGMVRMIRAPGGSPDSRAAMRMPAAMEIQRGR